MTEEDENKEEQSHVATSQQPITIITEATSTNLLNELWKHMPNNLETTHESSTIAILRVVCTIYRFHPDSRSRFDCLQMIFEAIQNPKAEQALQLEKRLAEIHTHTAHSLR